MLPDHSVDLIDRGYGKNYVRLLYVHRQGDYHMMKEIEVNTRLTLNSAKDYIQGNNNDIVATDTQKNTVYILAKQNGIRTIEEFSMQLSEHFLKKYDQVIKTKIYIEEKAWCRVKMDGQEHKHAFVLSGEHVRFCQTDQQKHGLPAVSAGLKNMQVLKTTKSAFVNFVDDEFRSLPDMPDRIFCTIVYASWKYHTLQDLNFQSAWDNVKDSIIEMFAGPADRGIESPSVQKTLYDAEKLALSRVPQISEIHMEFPNVHAYEFDLKKFPAFGFRENNEVFMPTDKPSGLIAGSIRRRDLPKSKL